MIKLIHFNKSSQAPSLLDRSLLRSIACPAPSSGERPETVGLISVTNGGWAACRHGHYKWKKRSWRIGLYSQEEFKSGILHSCWSGESKFNCALDNFLYRGQNEKDVYKLGENNLKCSTCAFKCRIRRFLLNVFTEVKNSYNFINLTIGLRLITLGICFELVRNNNHSTIQTDPTSHLWRPLGVHPFVSVACPTLGERPAWTLCL